MTVLFYVAAAATLLFLASLAFVRANPTRLADTISIAGPAALGLAGIGMMLMGRAGLGGMAISGALAWYTSARIRRGRRRSPGKVSTVRTAALEMELDHDKGSLEGVVLVGSHEGKTLGQMDFAQLLELRAELAQDAESLQLVETYLDGRFPGWRDDAQGDGDPGLGGAPGTGAMTEQEAYQILGIEPGAGAADIRKAHRRLMQRVHPDMGGSSFLAARINAAKDFLLSRHR